MTETATLTTDPKTVNPYILFSPLEEKRVLTLNGNSLNEDFSIKVDIRQVREFRYNNLINNNLKARIYHLSIPEKWQREGVEEPNYLCREKAIEIAQYLYNDYNLHPERTGASIEGGILLHYINYINNKTLSIEIDNDLEIAAVVNRDKTIEKSFDIFNFDFSEIIRIYAS